MGHNTPRALALIALVTVSGLMLAPTVVEFTAEDPEAAALPEWYTDIFDQKMVLGLDLQGGIHLQYKVDIEQALKRKAVQIAGTIEVQMKAEREVEVTAKPGDGETIDEITTVTVTFPDEESTDKLDQDFVNRFIGSYEVADVTDTVMTLVMSDQSIEEFRTGAVDQAIETIERRINAFGVAESTISRRGESELVVQLPGIKEEDFAAAKEKLAQTGQLRFQIVDRSPAQAEFYRKIGARKPDPAAWPEELAGISQDHKVALAGPTVVRSTSREIIEYMVKDQYDADHMIGIQSSFAKVGDANLQEIGNLSELQEDATNKLKGNLEELHKALRDDDAIVPVYEPVFLFRKAGMSGENVTDASVGYDEFNRPVVNMAFDQVDADRFYKMTQQYTKELMAIMIDDEVYSAPRIKEPIPGGRVQIEMGAVGNTAFKEAKALVAVLKSGALQAPLRKLYDTQVGPSLGADSVAAGRLSIIIGFCAVVVFMALYYKAAGFVANLALLLNLLFVMAGLTAFGATLTLPGIAGIVLTVGMAVDANVIIFERIREELRVGKSVRAAIDTGYEKAFSAIFDANVTTAIAAVVLYQFGSGPIRGFAVTLGIGIICSLYTALMVTRLVFERMYGRGAEPARMSI